MRIKETYIIYSKRYSEYVKLHYCIYESGSHYDYYLERNNGKISNLTGEEFFNLLDDSKS